MEAGDGGGGGRRKEREGLPGPYERWGGESRLLRFVVMLFPFVT
jgi:hypothetical protein